MTNATSEPRVPESKPQPNTGKSAADPPDRKKQEAIEKIVRLLPDLSTDCLQELAETYKEHAGGGDKPLGHKVLKSFFDPNIGGMFLRQWGEELEGVCGILGSLADTFWIPNDSTGDVADKDTLLGVANLTQFCRERIRTIAEQATYASHAKSEKDATPDLPENAETSEPSQPADDTPAATADLGDIRERAQRIAGLVEAAYLCEGSITHGSGDKDAIEDYFTAISGSISVAASECRRLLADMDAQGGVA